MHERWKLQYVGRKINSGVFSLWMEPCQTNYYYDLLRNYQRGNAEVRVELFVYHDDDGYVESIELEKAIFTEMGYGESCDLSRQDYIEASELLRKVMPLRGSDKIISVIKNAIQSKSISNGFRPLKVNKKSITFSAPDQSVCRLQIRDLECALDLVFAYPGICTDKTLLGRFSLLFGENNLDMVYAILNSIEAPEKLKEEYEKSLPGLARPTSPEASTLQIDPALENETDEDHLAVLTKWVEKSEEIYVPELLYAIERYCGLFDENTTNQLLERLKELEAEPDTWASHVTALIYAFRKAQTIESRISALKYVYEIAKIQPPHIFRFVPNLHFELTEELACEIEELENTNR